MSRILKRPMFRKGGEVMEGIMTGIKPRQNYALGERVEEYQNVLKSSMGQPVGGDPLARFLIETGQGLVGGEGADRGSKLAEILGATEKPTQNLFAALDKKAASDRSVNLQGAILGIKGQQAVDIAKAKRKDNLQKEFSPENLRDRLFLERSKETKGFKKDLKQLKPYVTSTFDAITRRQLPTIEAFKGKNISYMPHSVRGKDVQYDVTKMIPGTIYFRPDQELFIYERDPEKNVILQYEISTGKVVREYPI
jgi:hypothetical protein